ncbi:TPA: Imm59 family immunity protein [Streptococcus suis]
MKSYEIVKLEGEIISREYDHIRYELFNQNSLSPFATHIFNKDSKYYVENRDERGELIGNPYIFENFEEAQEKFLGVLSNKVKLSEQYDEQFGFSPYIRRSSESLLDNQKPKVRHRNRERSSKRGPESSFSGGTTIFKMSTGERVYVYSEESYPQLKHKNTHLRRGSESKALGMMKCYDLHDINRIANRIVALSSEWSRINNRQQFNN